MVKSHDKISSNAAKSGHFVTDRSNPGGTESLINFNDINNWELHGVRLFLRQLLLHETEGEKSIEENWQKFYRANQLLFFWAVHKGIIIVICLYQDNNIQLRI